MKILGVRYFVNQVLILNGVKQISGCRDVVGKVFIQVRCKSEGSMDNAVFSNWKDEMRSCSEMCIRMDDGFEDFEGSVKELNQAAAGDKGCPVLRIGMIYEFFRGLSVENGL